MPTLEFKGKQYIYSHHHSVPFRELLVDNKQSLTATGKSPSLDDNLIIHGDNLHALKALMPQYAGKVKCIYIDPPYNTGNEGWCYNDNVNSPLMKEWIQKNANPVDKEDMQRHDKWLCMMYPRLKLLHELLADDGVIFVSIDDNEHQHLRNIMDEIFGDNNFIASFLWKKKGTSTNVEGATVSANSDYQLCYRKSHLGAINPRIKFKEERVYPHKDKEGSYRITVIEKKNTGSYKRDSMQFKILGQIPRDGKRWQIGEKTANLLEQMGRFIIEDGVVKRKIYDFEDKDTTSANPTFLPENCGSSDSAAKCLISILGEEGDFENPKPPELIKHLIDLKDKDAIILDSFAGSGTTAHAVLDLNKEDGGNRKFILVEMEDYADSITAERVRRVIKGVPTAKDEKLKAGLGGSFTFCELGKEISIEKIITGESLPDYGALAKYVFYTATGKSLAGEAKEKPDYFVGETDLYEVYLIYKPDIAFLRSNDSALNDIKLKLIAARNSKKEKLVFATAKYMGQKELSEQNITFCQLPYAIHKVAGA